jgi:O-antigen/teichoic acid export membrane protein
LDRGGVRGGAGRRAPGVRDFYRQGALVFAGLIASNILTYVLYATVARAVGVDLAGLFLSVVSAIMIGALPAIVAGYVIAKLAADAQGRDDAGTINALGLYATVSIVPVAIIVTIASVIAAGPLRLLFRTGDTAVIALAAAAFGLTFVMLIQRAVLQGAGRFGAYVVSNLIEGSLKAAAGLITLVQHGGVRLALSGFVLAVFAAAGFNAVQMVGQLPRARLSLPGSTFLRHFVGIALPIAALTAVTFADVVLVRRFLDTYDSGLYSAVALVGRAALTALGFVPTVLMPRAAAALAAGQSSVRLLAAACAVTAGAVFAALILAALVPGTLIALIAGRAFLAASPYVLEYVTGMGALAGATVLTSYLIAIERRGFVIPMTVVACGEVLAIALQHSDLWTVVRIVLVGHSTMLACCIVDVLLLLARRGADARRLAVGER